MSDKSITLDDMLIDDLGLREEIDAIRKSVRKGGPGSGHHGHAGRPHERGGSLPDGVYVPDPNAPVKGEWDRSGDEPKWRQQHEALVREAMHSWKGTPSTMRIHMHDEAHGAPMPGSGSGKRMRAEAGALLWELTYKSIPSPVPLYRGTKAYATAVRTSLRPWTEKLSLARGFAGKDGTVRKVPKGTYGLRIADYIGQFADDIEKEWILRDEVQAEVRKGGPGSGHYGHLSEPGHRGGSLPRGAGTTRETTTGGIHVREVPEPQKPPGAETPLKREDMTDEEFQEMLRTGTIEKVEYLGGGISDTYFGYINGIKVKVTPQTGLVTETLRRGVEIMRDNHHEMAAQILNRELGNLVKFPITAFREKLGFQLTTDNGGLVQEFAPGTTLTKAGLSWDRLPREQLSSMALFDNVIGNVDRHVNNILVDKTTGNSITSIDHGLAFPIHNKAVDYGNREAIDTRIDNWGLSALADKEVERLTGLQSRRAEISVQLQPYLDKLETDALWQRVDHMVATKELQPVGRDWTGPVERGHSQLPTWHPNETPSTTLPPRRRLPVGETTTAALERSLIPRKPTSSLTTPDWLKPGASKAKPIKRPWRSHYLRDRKPT